MLKLRSVEKTFLARLVKEGVGAVVRRVIGLKYYLALYNINIY